MKYIRRPNGCFLSRLNRVVSPDPNNNRVFSTLRSEDVFRKAALILCGGIPLVSRPIYKAKVLYPVIPLIAVDVVHIKPIRNITIVPYPYQPMQEDTSSANRDFSVGACSGTSIACDLFSAPSDTWTPNPPKQFSLGTVIKHALQFFFGWYSAGMDHDYTPVLKCN